MPGPCCPSRQHPWRCGSQPGSSGARRARGSLGFGSQPGPSEARRAPGSLAGQAVPLPLLPPRDMSWCLCPGLALLFCPRSRLLFLLTDQDPSAPASVGMAEGQGDLGWLRPYWGSQGFPREGRRAGSVKSHGIEQPPGPALPWGWTPAAASPHPGSVPRLGPWC